MTGNKYEIGHKVAHSEQSWRDDNLNVRSRVALFMYERFRARMTDYVSVEKVAKELGVEYANAYSGLHELYSVDAVSRRGRSTELEYAPKAELRDVMITARKRPTAHHRGANRSNADQPDPVPDNPEQQSMELGTTMPDGIYPVDVRDALEDALAFLEVGRIDRVRAKLERMKELMGWDR